MKHAACLIGYDAKGKVLFLQRSRTDHTCPGKFCLPGGGVEDGESQEKALIREIWEETHIRLSSYSYFRSLVNDHIKITYFSGFLDEEIILNEESEQFLWVDQQTIDNLEIAWNQKDIVKDFWKAC